MKEGDICQIDELPGWYLWFKHKVRDGKHGLDFVRGAWIVSAYQGKSPAQALVAGEVFSETAFHQRKDKITRIGNLPVHPGDIIYPQFYSVYHDGNGKIHHYLHDGYKQKKVRVKDRVVQDDSQNQRVGWVAGTIRTIKEGPAQIEMSRKGYRIDHSYTLP